MKYDLVQNFKILNATWLDLDCMINFIRQLNTFNKHLLNILSVFLKERFFKKIIDINGKEKFTKYIANEISFAIDEMGPLIVIQMMVDNVLFTNILGI